MGYLIDDGVDELVIPGTGGERVVMRRQATFSDDLRIGQLVVGVPDDERTERFAVLRTLAMIESWTLKGRDGEALPVDAEAFGLRGLKRQVAGWLSNEAARRWGDRPQEDELPFGSRSKQSPAADPASTPTSSSSSPSSTSPNGLAGSPKSSSLAHDG